MNPTFDIKGEHAAITIILNAMKKLALDMRTGKFIDSYRIVQILDFLHTFTEHCHYEKEERILYPALLNYDIPWTADAINHLIKEHKIAHNYINEIDTLFDEYLSGNNQNIDRLSLIMLKYVDLEKKHIKIVENVLLPLCDRVFDSAKLTSISFDFNEIKNQNIGHLKHHEYCKLLAMLNAENDIMQESAY